MEWRWIPAFAGMTTGCAGVIKAYEAGCQFPKIRHTSLP